MKSTSFQLKHGFHFSSWIRLQLFILPTYLMSLIFFRAPSWTLPTYVILWEIHRCLSRVCLSFWGMRFYANVEVPRRYNDCKSGTCECKSKPYYVTRLVRIDYFLLFGAVNVIKASALLNVKVWKIMPETKFHDLLASHTHTNIHKCSPSTADTITKRALLSALFH